MTELRSLNRILLSNGLYSSLMTLETLALLTTESSTITRAR